MKNLVALLLVPALVADPAMMVAIKTPGSSATENFLFAQEAFANRETSFPPTLGSFAKITATHLEQHAATKRKITAQDQIILGYTMKGWTTKEIVNELRLGKDAVNKHERLARRALDIPRRMSYPKVLVAYYQKYGLPTDVRELLIPKISEVVQKLPENLKNVFQTMRAGHFNTADIAEELGVSHATASKWLSLINRVLRERVQFENYHMNLWLANALLETASTAVPSTAEPTHSLSAAIQENAREISDTSNLGPELRVGDMEPSFLRRGGRHDPLDSSYRRSFKLQSIDNDAPLPAAETPQKSELIDNDQAIINGLAAGLSYAAIGLKLGVSRKKVYTRIQAIRKAHGIVGKSVRGFYLAGLVQNPKVEQLAQQILRIVRHLPLKQRQIFAILILTGYSYEDIADTLGISKISVIFYAAQIDQVFNQKNWGGMHMNLQRAAAILIATQSRWLRPEIPRTFESVAAALAPVSSTFMETFQFRIGPSANRDTIIKIARDAALVFKDHLSSWLEQVDNWPELELAPHETLILRDTGDPAEGINMAIAIHNAVDTIADHAAQLGTPYDGRIVLHLRPFTDQWTLELEDNGEGFSRQNLARWWEFGFSTKPKGDQANLPTSRSGWRGMGKFYYGYPLLRRHKGILEINTRHPGTGAFRIRWNDGSGDGRGTWEGPLPGERENIGTSIRWTLTQQFYERDERAPWTSAVLKLSEQGLSANEIARQLDFPIEIVKDALNLERPLFPESVIFEPLPEQNWRHLPRLLNWKAEQVAQMIQTWKGTEFTTRLLKEALASKSIDVSQAYLTNLIEKFISRYGMKIDIQKVKGTTKYLYYGA